MIHRIAPWMLILLLSFSLTALATSNNQELDRILQNDEAPAGVVFEIVEWDDDALSKAIPWVNQQIITLRKRFPNLDIAIVSHGSEQFALLSDSKNTKKEIHSSVQRLITDHNIELELCLNHAQMRGFEASDFPEYVDISQSGPSSIDAYEDLGFELVGVNLE